MMQNSTFKNRIVLLLIVLAGFTSSCKKDEDAPAPATTKGKRTTTIDYNTLTPTTSYRTAFLDNDGDTTVNRNDGRARLRMFRALMAYIGTAVSTNTPIDSTIMSNMFANKNAPFTGGYADLNGVDMSIKEATAFLKANQADVHYSLEYAFGRMAYISNYTGQTASKGTPGKNGSYLVDENGIEWAQIIQKTLIGAYHLDYICNVLLNKGLNADNAHLVTGKKYTQLEHNWDEAYGFFTVNDMYYNGATDQAAPKVSNEYYLGSYAWEYNKAGFVQLHSAFLKGRAAIHNNDMTQVHAQARIIRNILELTIGASANGYMGKASDGTATEASRIHAFGEGKGFVYSTRFCTLIGGDDIYSDDLLDDLITPQSLTFYDITAAQFTSVANKLRSKFGLQ